MKKAENKKSLNLLVCAYYCANVILKVTILSDHNASSLRLNLNYIKVILLTWLLIKYKHYMIFNLMTKHFNVLCMMKNFVLECMDFQDISVVKTNSSLYILTSYVSVNLTANTSFKNSINIWNTQTNLRGKKCQMISFKIS